MTPKQKADELVDKLGKEHALIACDVAIEERERAIKIVNDFRANNKRQYETYKNAFGWMSVMYGNFENECRLMANAIADVNALGAALNESEFWQQVKQEINGK